MPYLYVVGGVIGATGLRLHVLYLPPGWGHEARLTLAE